MLSGDSASTLDTSTGFDAPPGDPQALFRLADALDNHATSVGTLGSNTLRTSTDIRGRAAWEGDAAEGYTAFTGGVAKGVGTAESPLSRIATHIRSYAGALKTAQDEAGAAHSDALKAAASSSASEGAAPVESARQRAQTASASADAAAEDSKTGIDAAVEQLNKMWEGSEPVRAWIEKVKGPWDALGVDFGVGRAIAGGEQAEKQITAWKAGLTKLQQEWFTDDVGSVAHEYDHGLASGEDLEAAWAKFASKTDAAEGFLAQWEGDTSLLRGALPFLKVTSKLAGGTALLGDLGTVIKPEDSGAMGNVDRGVAVANAGLVGADLAGVELADVSLLGVPGVGEAALIGTGVYLGGDYLYHHWKPFHDVCNDVGHGTVAAVDDVGHGVSSAAKAVGGWLGL